jgi:hypothetical protein
VSAMISAMMVSVYCDHVSGDSSKVTRDWARTHEFYLGLATLGGGER